MITHLFDTAFQSFWHFVGTCILIAIPSEFVITLIKQIAKWHVARKHGWPKEETKYQQNED